MSLSELKKAQGNAYSLKSKDGLIYIGSIEEDNRVYRYYKDKKDNYFFEVMFKRGKELITEEEHIFGRKLPKLRRRKAG